MVANNDCVPREQLKEYLAGWSAPEQSDWIESHVADCSTCEQTIVDLECDPETLVDFVRQVSPAGHVPKQIGDEAVNNAIEEAKAIGPSEKVEQATVSTWEPENCLIDAYELEKPLGRGGMGAVYSAKHTQLGKRVAIKLLPTRSFRNEQFAARFKREIRAAGGVDHPAIVRATDAGETEGTHYLVMELIDGLDLSRIAKLHKTLSVADACATVRQVALGLSHAHAEGIVHRDIKPSNLMLNMEGQTKILDFGLARLGPWDECSADLTTVGQLMGTLDYMAPEQAENAEAVDFRADLYALGATLFRLLCGRPPLAAAPDLSPLAKLRLLATQSPPDVRTLRSDVPDELASLLASLLSSDPNARPASAAHVAEMLAPFCEGADLQALVVESKKLAEENPIESSTSRSMAPAGMPLKLKPEQNTPRKLWVLNACLLAALALAGFWIVLETQKGQLVIDSEVETKVTLRKDGKQVKELQIQPGANTTRLYAGKYEVELLGASDRVQISENSIAILRGKTQVATVTLDQESGTIGRQKPKDALVLDSTPDDPVPVYQGKSIEAWLNVLKTERSDEELSKAYQAIATLASGENYELVTRAVLSITPRLNGEQDLMTGPDSKSSVDYAMFNLLKEINEPSDYANLVLQELRTPDIDWQKRVMKTAVRFDLEQPLDLVQWFETEMFFASQKPANIDTAIELVAGWSFYVEDAEVRRRMENCLRLSPNIDSEYWIRHPVVEHNDARGLKFSKESALNAFLDLDTAPDLTIQSTALLLALIRQGQLEDEELRKISEPLINRLGSIRAEQLTELIETDEFPPEYLVPRTGLNSVGISSYRSMGGRTMMRSAPVPSAANRQPGLFLTTSARTLESANLTSLLVELVSLQREKEWHGEFGEGLQHVRGLLEQDYGDVIEAFKASGLFLSLQWPLTDPVTFSVQGFSRGSRNSRSSSPSKSAFDPSGLTRDDWVALILFEQVKLPEVEDSSATPPARTSPSKSGASSSSEDGSAKDFMSALANRSSRKKSTESKELLYEGRALSEWLDILPRERSIEGVATALTALRAMVTDATREQIALRIEETLPKADGWNYSATKQAFDVLLYADGRRLGQYMLGQLKDSDDVEWKKRLLIHAPLEKMTVESFRPLAEWLQANAFEEKGPLLTTAIQCVSRVGQSKTSPDLTAELAMDVLSRSGQFSTQDWFAPVRSKATWSREVRSSWVEYATSLAKRIVESSESDSGDRVAAFWTLGKIQDGQSQQLPDGWLASIAKKRLTEMVASGNIFEEAVVDRNLAKPLEITDFLVFEGHIRSEDGQSTYRATETQALLHVLSERTEDREVQALAESIVEQTTKQAAKCFVETYLGVNFWEREYSTGGGRGNNLRFPGWRIGSSQVDAAKLDRRTLVGGMLYITAGSLLEKEAARLVSEQLYENMLKIAASELIDAYDEKEDGKLDSEEFAFLMKERPILELDTSLDADEDGLVTELELARLESSPQYTEVEKEWALRQIAKYDQNNDGMLSQAECSKMLIKPKGADSNMDGILTVEEYAAFRAKR